MSHLETSDFRTLPLLVRVCGSHWGLSSGRAHDDSLFVPVRVLIFLYILLCTPSRLVGCAEYSFMHEGGALSDLQRSGSIHLYIYCMSRFHWEMMQGHNIREYIAGDTLSCVVTYSHVCPWSIQRWWYRLINFLGYMCDCMNFHIYWIAWIQFIIFCMSTMICLSRGSSNDRWSFLCMWFAIKSSFIGISLTCNFWLFHNVCESWCSWCSKCSFWW